MKYLMLCNISDRMRFVMLSLLYIFWLSISVNAQKIIYVSPTGTADGSEWTKTTSLSNALNLAVAGDEIWLLGFKEITDLSEHVYIAPKEGWTVPSGVKIYGGFEGTEISVNQRRTLGKAYQLTFRSILSGDIDGDDVSDAVNAIFPQNETRKENAEHVLLVNTFRNTSDNSNDNSYPTVVNGLTIVGGHSNDFGGGIYVRGGENCVPYSVERCYFINNYAPKGGAVYVDETVKNTETKSIINQCVVYNNASGTLIGKKNLGGGIYIAGAGNIVNSSIFNNESGGVVLSQNAYLVNSTVARNTGGGVDMTVTPINTDAHVYNSVIWGNSFVFSDIEPYFSNSAYSGALDENGNINISVNNQGDKMSPRFDAPSIKTSYDADYDWRRSAYPLWSWKLQEGSWLINKGNNLAYENLAKGYYGVINTDLSGSTRIIGDIDINAYEFQAMPAERIRYVRTDGNDANDGLSWATAYKSVQKAINELAEQSGVPGEVWIAAGTYQPTELISGSGTPALFRMYDGISLYGGFSAQNPEDSKAERKKVENGMPWQFINETILQGSTFNGDVKWNETDYKWALSSASTHVVWFAPLSDTTDDFVNLTLIEGVTIEGGQARQTEAGNFYGDMGAGIYIRGQKAYLVNSVVRNNVAASVGGGVYLKDGRVQGCLVYNNSSETSGGGIYVDNAGLVLRCMVTNNSAFNGGGVYLDCNGTWEDGKIHQNYQILSTSVVTNNTSVHNGAVYCNNGGIVIQTTIANNYTPTATDAAAGFASQTGGLYIDSYAKVINTVLWNNKIKEREVQLYASNASSENVDFYYSAVANMQSIIWNNILQQEIMAISGNNQEESDNSSISPGFESGYPESTGVQGGLTEISYFWRMVRGSNLRARGMSLGLLPDEVLVAPELDIEGKPFNTKPTIGAYNIESTDIVPELGNEEGKDYIRIYVNVECTEPTHDGSSWNTAYRSLNEAIEYMAELTADEVGTREQQIYIMEGDIWPRYAAVNLDPRTATIKIPEMASGKKLVIKGGFSSESTEYGAWAPLIYRSQINGNHEGKDIRDGLYHCITVEKNAKVEFDGFHIINGYAAETANLKYGAGMLVRDGAQVTVKNTIFENNTAIEGAAVDARGATLELVNCVINNNTNTENTSPVINVRNLTMHHVSVANNIGAAPASMGTSSFAAGNTYGNSHTFVVDRTNFVNPTKDQGATLGFNTVLGGYSSFMPTNQCEIVNKGSTSSLTTDITGNSRSRGGAPDLGAYEADLPVDGTVIYVRKEATGDRSGSSWGNACATIGSALSKAKAGQEIWVSAGTYVENIDMVEGVNVLGGFAATGNPTNKIDGINRDISHKIENFKTIIQGSEDYKFEPTQADVKELDKNNKRVLTQPSNFVEETLWEGFIITGGQTGLAEYGAGVKLMKNGHLKNCRVEGNKFYECGQVEEQRYNWFSWRRESVIVSHDTSNHTGGGGVYCSGGIVENCQIIGNILDGYKFNYEYQNNRRYYSEGLIYGKGAGLSISGGDIINTVIAQNVAGYDPVLYPSPTNHLTNILGSAAFVQNQSNFYSSTIVENTGGWADKDSPIVPGVWDESLASGDGSYFYNCIIIGNYGYGSTKESFMQIGKGLNQVPKNLMYSFFSLVKFSDGSQSPATSALDSNRHNKYADFGSGFQSGDIDRYTSAYNLLSLLTDDFELNVQNGTNPCLNTGSEEYLHDGNINILLDANGYDRIQDCTLDMGAYESTNETNIAYETSSDGKTLVYYVNQNGAGLRNGASLANAACEMKLQQIITHAGKTALANNDKNVIVKIAGYEGADPFVYRASTLENPDDPQSYTFVIPYGVTVEGGYDGMSDVWDESNRNPKKYRTVLSAIANETDQDVNGYHTITFGEKPDGWVGDDKTTIIDGLYLIDGKATSMAGEGNPNTRGGGAIVESWAHVRNCVVANCEAIQGGGLYLMPGATVSGSLIMGNKAEEGAGVYADNEGAGDDLRSHMISNTITDNEAVYSGGGIYYEDGAVMTVNSVIWGNTASSDKNVCGAASLTFGDTKFESVESKVSSFYPFNNSYVETYELPSNFENTSMKSEENFYFTADRTLKAYSELIKHGIETGYQEKFVEVFGISDIDMQGNKRIQPDAQRIDVGAYAYEGGVIPLPDKEEDVVTRIFVNKEINVIVKDDMDKYIGRSFYTSLSWLDDALDYIKKVREKFNDIEFDIYLAQGTYKPSNRRSDATTEVIDQRQNSYVIPSGVNIYGGFKGDEQFSFEITSIDKADGGIISLTPVSSSNLNTFLDMRTYSDLNSNGINEPWEMEYQSILSGDINVSPTVRNAYHVVYSSEANDGSNHKTVFLDGLTIKDGETWYEMSSSISSDERGRGGAIYTNGVDYILKGCRLMNCKGVRGGAVYARDANLTIIGSAFSGNGTVDGAITNGQDIRGGAVYVSGYSQSVSLKAINTLWANNETKGKGGAIATSNDLGFDGNVSLSLMNNTIVRNKAEEASAIYSVGGKGTENKIVNTVMWGGEETGLTKGPVSNGLVINNSASETILEGDNNVKLNLLNMAIDGPRFVAPTKVAGVEGWDLTSKWSPASISLLTDAGDGELDYYNSNMGDASGAYRIWWTDNDSENYSDFYTGDGIMYKRYMGQKPIAEEVDKKKIIDIGVYEYQYKSNFEYMNEIYVDVQDHGDASGDSWDNATSDLRGSVVALSNPEGGNSENRIIHVRGGEYSQSQLYVGGIAYQAVMNSQNELFNTLTIKGSYAENGIQDFSNPTVLLSANSSVAEVLFYVKTEGKNLDIEGVTFEGATDLGFESDNAGALLKFKNVAFRRNNVGAEIKNTQSGSALMANVLFADGNTGFVATGGNMTVVNATFANNTKAFDGNADICNTVSWKSGTELVTSESLCNINLGDVANDDILNGPNFVDPSDGDYMIRPSIMLLNTADKEKYNSLLGTDAVLNDMDLASNARLTGDGLDIGAYEYNAPLNQIVYVKSNVAATDGSGSSWENPIKDLQGAIDLASVYTNKNPESDAYVFVHHDVKDGNIRVSMPGVKIYGGMNDESGSSFNEILNARLSIISSDMSTIDGLNLTGSSSLVDGFLIKGSVTVDNAMISTSVLEGNIFAGESGIVYNSFLSGTLDGNGKAVNVTAVGLLDITNKINVIENAVLNRYITTDIWKYQLNEDAGQIDNEQNADISEYISKAGHSKDISSSPRIRNIVDAGCFETWYLKTNERLYSSNDLTENHVVYVCKDVEFDIAGGLYGEGKPFNLGFLLLEHGAGLRSNGNSISLTNFAVERNLDENNKRWDMLFMPFDITRVEGAENITVMKYNGARRAEYGYKFSSTDGAWDNVSEIKGNAGQMIQSDSDTKVRMFGNSYVEKAGQSGCVELTKYNNMEPWTSKDDISEKFTHLENMSWNMFGSPFLCAMNYDDMEYGRVIYKKIGDTYEAVNTMDVASGSIESGSAVFTQTATLQTSEIFSVNQRTEPVSPDNIATGNLVIAISGTDNCIQDKISINAVASEDASSEFNMAEDGVKMMSVSADAPQIYIEREGKRYSLLSAVDIQGTVEVGLNVKASGMYTVSIPEDCETMEYETVVLTDKSNGRTVDLLDGGYDFAIAEAGDVTGRFTIQFNRMEANDGSSINVYTEPDGVIVVEGLDEGMTVRLFDSSGKIVNIRKDVSVTERFTVTEAGVYLVQVKISDSEQNVFKVIVSK